MTIAEFLEKNGPALFATAERLFPAKVTSPRLQRQGGRRPLGAQALAITGVARALEAERAVFLTGEMGTGKTFMAIRAALEWKPRGRFLVLCPPHLVEKWEREVGLEGAEALILRSVKDIERLREMPRPLFAVLSREKAKLGSGWVVSAAQRKVRVGGKTHSAPVCPRCYRKVVSLPTTRRSACQHCKEPLWQEAPPRREALAHALRRRLPRRFFDLVVLDEAHEYKGSGSAQGMVAGSLVSWCGKALLLTGTLFGGYASSIYHLLVRALPQLREDFPSEADFIAQYGVYEQVYREREERGYGAYTRRREVRSRSRERPGLSPLLLVHLIGRGAFVRLPEVAEALPPYGEEVRLVEMEAAHRAAYEAFSKGLGGAVRQALAQGSHRLLGALVQAGIQVPDTTWQEEAVHDPETGSPVARFQPLAAGYRHAKEEALIRLVLEERARGRRSIVFVQGTERRDQLARLGGLLRERGCNPIVLRAETVKPEERERWLEAQVKAGGDVLLCHPRVVQTGLDLIHFPTVVFYQPEYSVYTLRQAARRSWRIGQEKPVRVVFMAYRETLQEAALALIAKKARSSLALEGELVEGGLVSVAEEDPTLALARALAGASNLAWNGEIRLEERPPVGITLPTLPEPVVVRVGRRKVRFEAGQPVLFW